MCNHKWMTFGADKNGNYRICSKCNKKVYIITNADRIRAMSDEKLAEWLACPICKYASCKKTCPAILPNADPCEIQILSWLQQPAEEDTK